MGKPLRDLTDQRFGFLVALRLGEKQRRDNGAWWLCRCDCGTEKNLPAHDLVRGKIMSCGCQHEALKDINRVIHGKSKGDRTYRIWQAMLNRCRNAGTPAWARYGGRGITVCARWSVFEDFLADMGQAPADRSIDRIDNDGNYEPANCRWATRVEQANNARHNVRITYDGQTLTRSQWEQRLGLGKTTLRGRLSRGLSLAEAMIPAWQTEGNEPAPAPEPHTPTAKE
jgi:hypothetical protein